MKILDDINTQFAKTKVEYMTLEEYFEGAKNDPGFYRTAAERMVAAIGEAELVDTSQDPILARIFQNRTIKRYPAFKDFYGMEETIERIVGFFTHAAQGLEEAKQVLYFLGPVGGGKSTLANHIKSMMQKEPIYVLCVGNTLSPCLDSPLGLFDPSLYAETFEKEFNIPSRYLTGTLSPWAVKRLDEFDGDIKKFRVAKLYPNKQRQVAIARTEPGDENNQDISTLVGKVDLRKLDRFPQNDPDAYSYSGALCRGNQGIVELVEIWKAPIKTLHPLLTAVQEQCFTGTEEIGSMPFAGIVIAHSNESEWSAFKENKNNEAFLDRVYTIKVPYALRYEDEVKIYKKMISNSELREKKCAPQTLDMLAQFAVLSRLVPVENSSIFSKLRVYNGESVQEQDVNAKTIAEYRSLAHGKDEGMDGISTRFAFKILSNTYNFDSKEISADPVHLMHILDEEILRQQFPQEMEQQYKQFLKHLAQKYADFLEKEINKAYVESYSDYGQNLFDRYVNFAEAWLEKNDFKDPDTGAVLDRDYIDGELQKIEKPAGVVNAKDFRNEVVKFVLKFRSTANGKNPKWTAYEKLREVIEKKMFAATEELLPVISFTTKKTKDEEKKHNEFIARMSERGYTPHQSRRLVEWFMRHKKAG